MKTTLRLLIIAVVLLAFPKIDFGQAPNLGTAANFVLFTTVGAVTNVGTTDPAKYLTHLTGNVGSNSGSSTGFGNVNGVMHDGDGASNTCAGDLLLAYNFLSAAIPDSSITNPIFGNDSTLKAGTYLLPGATSLNLSLTLDAQGDPNAVFIFKMPASPPVFALNTSPNSRIILKNGAKASNVFWLVTGAVNVGTGTSMKGTIISGGAISFSANDTLEGRALTINGAINIDNGNLGFLGYIPVKSLTGPKAPVFNEAKSFTIFSSNGAIADDNFSHIVGDVGGNTNAPSNYNPLFVTGGIYGINGITSAAAADLLKVYDTLNIARPEDIILLAPTLFGHNLVLTPHTYLMNAAVTFTDTLYLDALGNPNAVFIIKTNGAFATTANSKVALINGTQAKNVYWLVNGAVSITANSIFNGTIVTAGGAIDILSGTTLNGRALATNGAVSTASINATFQSNTVTGPISQAVCAGDIAIFTVSSSGTGLSYQWRKGNVDLVDGGNISGAMYDTLTISPVSINDTSSSYYVIIKEAFLPNDTSSKVSLMLNAIPTITKEPSSQSACIGDSTSLTVSAKGTNLTYQWKRGLVNVVNSANISGATNDTLTFKSLTVGDTAINYYVVVSGDCLPNDTSLKVAITTKPVIITQPINQTVCLGDSVSYIVKATGKNLTYQWKKGIVDLVDGGTISGAKSDTLTIKPTIATDASSDYSVVVSNSCAEVDSSILVSLVINKAPNITLQPVDEHVCSGDTARFTVKATGVGLTYQWRIGTVDLVSAGNVLDATASTLELFPVTIADIALNYNVVINGGCLPKITSANAALDLNTTLSITSEPISKTLCIGDSTSLVVVATGSNLTYQWRRGLANVVNTANIFGATNDTLTFKPVSIADSASNYYVVVSGKCSLNDTSKNVALALHNAPIISIEPIDILTCSGTSASLFVTATGSSLSYQWRKGLVNILGATSNTLTVNPVTAADTSTKYNVVVTGICSLTDTSKNVVLGFTPAPIISVEPIDITTCSGTSASLTVTATGSSLSYQWRKGLVNILGATSNTLTVNPVTAADTSTKYNVVVTGICSLTDTSKNVVLGITPAPIISIEPIDKTVCEGTSADFTVTATGSSLSYQWRKGIVNIPGATTNTLTINPVNAADKASNYNVVVTGSCSLTDTSKNVSLDANLENVITTDPTNQTVCEGSPVSFSVSATGSNLSYQWKKGTATINGATSNTFTINTATLNDADLNYSVILSGLCSANDTSKMVSLTVHTIPEALVTSVSPVCIGTSINIQAQTVTGASYLWENSKGYSSTLQNPVIVSATNADAGIYWLRVTVDGCTSDSTTLTIVVNNCDSLDFNIPEGFSPNGDNINDLFVIRGILSYPKNTFTVFNRWGEKVYNASPYLNTWDGTSNKGLMLGGNDLPIGTYFYILDLGDGTKVYKGTIYLNR